MKYSDNFNRDFKWYIKVRHLFNFDGSLDREIEYDPLGIDGKKCFHLFDSQGKLRPTKHPNLVRSLLKTKGSINLHIKMYAEDRAKQILPGCLFNELCEELKVPDWFILAVENQKIKYK